MIINPAIVSSPIKYIAKLITDVIIKINKNMLTVCLVADFTIPCSQSQCSFSHKSTIFSSSSFPLFFSLITKSIINPAIIPINNFIPKIFNITQIETPSDINIGNISSEVDKYTAIKVPNVMTLAEYRLVADTENPHCGNTPKTLPINGPNFPDFFIVFFVFSLVLCSIYSIIKYVKNKNGINFILSIIAS